MWESTLGPAWNKYITAAWNARMHGFNDWETIQARLQQAVEQGRVIGQEQAMEEVNSFLYSMMVDIYRHDVCGGDPHGHILVLAGPSGNGKSTVAKLILESVFKDSSAYMFIPSGALNTGSSSPMQPEATLRQKLFDDDTQNGPYGGGGAPQQTMIHKTASISNFFAQHQKAAGLCLDEYDKMCFRRGQTPDTSMDELLRAYADMGVWQIDAHSTISAENSLVILTTNESRRSLVNLNSSETTKALDIATAPEETTESPTLSTTQVSAQDGTTETTRDRSVLNRFQVVTFPKLSADSIHRIIRQKVEESVSAHRSFKGINLSFEDSIIEHFVEFTQTTNDSMHVVIKYIENQISGLVSATLSEYDKARQDITQKHFILYTDAEDKLRIRHEQSYPQDVTSVKFRKPDSWTHPYIYAYRTLENGTEESLLGGVPWPGLPMIESITAPGVYPFTLPSDFCQHGVRIMFNNGPQGPQIPARNEKGFWLAHGEQGILNDGFWTTRLNPQIEPVAPIANLLDDNDETLDTEPPMLPLRPLRQEPVRRRSFWKRICSCCLFGNSEEREQLLE